MLKNMIQSLEEEEKAMEKEFVTPRKGTVIIIYNIFS